MLNRRKLLSTLGITAAVSPLAAKAVLEKEVMSLAGTSLSAGGGSTGGPAIYGYGNPSPGGVSIPYTEQCIRASDFIKVTGLPEVIEKQLRQESRWCIYMDPDIAMKRSWSLAVKYQEQRQRNYERRKADLLDAGWRHRKRGLLAEVLGFHWPF